MKFLVSFFCFAPQLMLYVMYGSSYSLVISVELDGVGSQAEMLYDCV